MQPLELFNEGLKGRDPGIQWEEWPVWETSGIKQPQTAAMECFAVYHLFINYPVGATSFL